MSSKGHLTNFTPADFAALKATAPPKVGPGPTGVPGTAPPVEDEVPQVPFDNVEDSAASE